MKKDYVVVSGQQAVTDESAFVQDFWTKWRDNHANLPNTNVAAKEGYLIMRSFLRTLPPGSRILDGGCGMGAWTVFLSNQGFDVVGLDISQRTIACLKESLPNYHFVCGDIRHTDLADASFDAYFSWGTFEHFEKGLEESEV